MSSCTATIIPFIVSSNCTYECKIFSDDDNYAGNSFEFQDYVSLGTRIIFHPERELTAIVVVQCDFRATSAILIETMWQQIPGKRIRELSYAQCTCRWWSILMMSIYLSSWERRYSIDIEKSHHSDRHHYRHLLPSHHHHIINITTSIIIIILITISC